jgi:hypothetical protein
MKAFARRLTKLYPPRWRARYGREFDALIEDAKLTWRDLLDVMAGAVSAWISQGGNDPMEEIRPRVIDLQDRDIPHGYEFESVIEYPGAPGVTRHFWRELDFGESYMTLYHVSRNFGPAQTMIVSGFKGEIDGDFRTDRTEMLVLRPDGTVRRTQQTVKTWLKYEGIRETLRQTYRSEMRAGLTADEVFQKISAG